MADAENEHTDQRRAQITKDLRAAIVALPIALAFAIAGFAVGTDDNGSGFLLAIAGVVGAAGIFSLGRGLWYRVG